MPPETKLLPILCPVCLVERHAQRTWLDVQSICLVCPVHGPVLPVQTVERLA